MSHQSENVSYESASTCQSITTKLQLWCNSPGRGGTAGPQEVVMAVSEAQEYKPSSLSQICADASHQASKGGTSDAHGLSQDKDSLVAKRSNTQDFLMPTTHLLHILIFDIRIGVGHDVDCCHLSLGGKTCCVCFCLGFDTCALGNGFGSYDDGVCC
jgi:hypothetical protein